MESIRTSTAGSMSGLASAGAGARPTPAAPGIGSGAVAVVPQAAVQIPARPQVVQTKPSFDAGEMRKHLQDVAQMLNEQLRSTNTNLAFGVDPVGDRTVITVTDRGGDVVREIPGEVFLRVARSIERFIRDGASAAGFKGVELDELL